MQELCELAFARVGLNWKDHVVVEPALVRPAEVELLQGDASKAKRMLGWQPRVSFRQLVEMMVDVDLARYQKYQVMGRRLSPSSVTLDELSQLQCNMTT